VSLRGGPTGGAARTSAGGVAGSGGGTTSGKGITNRSQNAVVTGDVSVSETAWPADAPDDPQRRGARVRPTRSEDGLLSARRLLSASSGVMIMERQLLPAGFTIRQAACTRCLTDRAAGGHSGCTIIFMHKPTTGNPVRVDTGGLATPGLSTSSPPKSAHGESRPRAAARMGADTAPAHPIGTCASAGAILVDTGNGVLREHGNPDGSGPTTNLDGTIHPVPRIRPCTCSSLSPDGATSRSKDRRRTRVGPGKALFAVAPSRHRCYLPRQSPGWTFAWIASTILT